MSARWCKSCGIAFPVGGDFTYCHACKAPTAYDTTRAEDPAWESLVEQRVEDLNPSEERRVILWRVERFAHMGCDRGTSIRLAGEREPNGGFTVDVARFEALLKRGWTADQATAALL